MDMIFDYVPLGPSAFEHLNMLKLEVWLGMMYDSKQRALFRVLNDVFGSGLEVFVFICCTYKSQQSLA